MNAKVSVIVPVYNVENYITTCINSICKQKYTNLEIIVVDDGSSDNSGILCDELAQKDSRIQVLHKQNGGLSDARNCGISLATGEYLCFVDSDDYIDEEMISTLYMLIVRYNADISSCAYTMRYPDYDEIINEGAEVVCYSPEEAFKVLLHRNNIGVIAWNKMYKKDLFNKINYPVGQHFEDINTTYKLIDKAKRIVYTPKSYYYYVQRSTSINGNNFAKVRFSPTIYDMEKAADELFDFVKQKYPHCITDIAIGCIDYYLRVINTLLFFNRDNQQLMQKCTVLIKQYRKCIRTHEFITIRKKIQFFLFGFFPVLYKFIICFLY